MHAFHAKSLTLNFFLRDKSRFTVCNMVTKAKQHFIPGNMPFSFLISNSQMFFRLFLVWINLLLTSVGRFRKKQFQWSHSQHSLKLFARPSTRKHFKYKCLWKKKLNPNYVFFFCELKLSHSLFITLEIIIKSIVVFSEVTVQPVAVVMMLITTLNSFSKPLSVINNRVCSNSYSKNIYKSSKWISEKKRKKKALGN